MANNQSQSTKLAYASGNFQFQLDGSVSTTYLKSVDGGYIRASLIDEPIGPDLYHIKHTSNVDIEPIAIEVGMSGADDILKWIQASWRKEYAREQGMITHSDFDFRTTLEHHFHDALIAETTFPTLDGSSKDSAYAKIKIQPENVTIKQITNGPVMSPATASPKFKMWTPSSFRFYIDGIDSMKHVNKLDSFTIKQGIKKLYVGSERLPQIEPTKLEFPNLSGTIAAVFADDLFKWYDTYVVKGQSDPAAQRTGAIEFLSQDRKSVLFRINLYEVGLHHAQIEASNAREEGIKRCKFELYIGRMDLDLGSNGFDT